ncbi:unnamed protein product [Cyclocybe aegerita]|uniref:Phosphatidylglycerol lysyltransferase C-terminal domain-containing protein n=1 Tax=Cyclocybe aegerita TaxID=1973307 RepID=A0A8S0W3K1_CYCAE|nr:unnamed protein product [Cyclocybe aegerita]
MYILYHWTFHGPRLNPNLHCASFHMTNSLCVMIRRKLGIISHHLQMTIEKSSIADLVARYGSSSATAWLEFDRYKLWQPSKAASQSSFTPVQGYMEKGPYIFAWGNPLVSDPAALPSVARQFIDFCESRGKRPVWSCVDRELEKILGGDEFGWSTVSCIYEDVIDPAHVLELTSPEAKGQEGQKVVKDLKKNLHWADKYAVKVSEVKGSQWTDDDKIAIEQGIREWKSTKGGVQIASTTLQPWLDSEHRRYWSVGVLVLTPIQASSWQIKNAVSFPSAPKGTSEALIYTALKDLHDEQERAVVAGQKIPNPANGNYHGEKVEPCLNQRPSPESTGSTTTSTKSSVSISSANSIPMRNGAETPDPASASAMANGISNGRPEETTRNSVPRQTHHRDADQVTVTFGISAAPGLEPIHNLGGWKVSALSKTYGKVAKGAKLIQRGEFRSKFDTAPDPMYVCYPPNGFGLEGVNALLKVLKK